MTESYLTIPLTSITIPPERQRKTMDPKSLDELSESIKLMGQLVPIIVDDSNGSYTLVAGYRRYKAIEMLGRKDIEAKLYSDLSDWEKAAIEFEENIRRANLEYRDQLIAELHLHELYRSHYGIKPSQYSHTGTGHPVWKVTDTAKLLGFSAGKMSERLNLARAIKEDPSLGEFKSETQAKHELERRQTNTVRMLLAASKLSEQADQPQNTDFPSFKIKECTLINSDSRLVIPSLQNDSIGALITDPPWNVQFDSTFGGDPKQGFNLTAEILKLLHPKLQDGSICVMYCATKHLITGEIYQLVSSCGYAMFQTIHIWYKPNIAGTSQPYRELKNDYEPALLFSKGPARNFNTPMNAVIQDATKPERIHPAQKSVPVLEQLICNFTVQGELVIDPFMGSGTTMLACALNQRRGLGIELTKDSYAGAIELLTSHLQGQQP